MSAPRRARRARRSRSSVGSVLVAALVAFVVRMGFVAYRDASSGRSTGASTSAQSFPTQPSVGALTDIEALVPWVPWTSTDGSFSLEFPTAPRSMATPPSEYIERAESVVSEGVTSYMLLHYTIRPGVVWDPVRGLAGTIDGMASGGGFDITERTTGTFAFSPSVSFVGAVPGGGDLVYGFGFASPTRAYVLMASGPRATQAELDRFVASFVAR